MKQLRVYKHLRRKPQIFGFTPKGFYIFMIVSILSVFILTTGFSLVKLMIVGVIIFITLIITKFYISNDKLIRKMSDEKFPKEISALTKTKK